MDRRTIWAIMLMMVIAVVPALFLKKPTPADKRAGGQADSVSAPAPDSQAQAPAVESAPDRVQSDSLPAGPPGRPSALEDTVSVTSPFYAYGISTRGARLVQAELQRYASMAAGEQDRRAQILPPNSDLLSLTVVRGRDTVDFKDAIFTPSTSALSVNRPESLTLTAEREGARLELTYTFQPDDYRIDVQGQATDIGPNGGALVVGMGPTINNTEANADENHRDMAVVTKRDDTERIDLGGLEPGERRVLSGPFQWTAIKSKYFVTGILARDSIGISGATVTAPRGSGKTHSAEVRLSIPLRPSGEFGYTVYAGPMEYDRLARLGHDFDDVNPYGWPGFRTIIRIFAVPVRWLLVWMHEHLHLTYGLVLVVFGILVRVVLWPLNQKAMRANMKLQEVQPLMKDIQERHKSDPQRMQQEMFKLYRDYKVNPLGGCWPMLLPMPVLFALFFVFQNAIELRGTAFMWIPDLSRPDPLYIIPIVMGASMYFLTKVGQMGMEPNPQMKMMLYMMPLMMTGMFLFFPSGLNLYYTVSNIASIPQQWLLGKERMKRTARAIVDVKTERPTPQPAPAKKRKKA